MRKLLKYSAVFTVFLAFHAHAADFSVDKNVVRGVNENFCVTNNNSQNAIVAYPTTGAYNYSFSIDGIGTYCSDLYSLADLFQETSNLPFGEGLRIVVGNTTENPSFIDDCVTAGTYEACAASAGIVSTNRILTLRTQNSILGAQSSGEYVAAVAQTAGNTIDDFYPIAAAALGLIVAFALLGYIIATFPDNTKELEKVKKLSREVDEHIDRTTESYKAWNRRLGNLFRE